jgi:membrane protease subunit HflK
VAQAQGDGQRFKSLLAEYQKAPQVTRDRLYIESMQQIYGNVTKILVDSKQGSNMLFLPLGQDPCSRWPRAARPRRPRPSRPPLPRPPVPPRPPPPPMRAAADTGRSRGARIALKQGKPT